MLKSISRSSAIARGISTKHLYYEVHGKPEEVIQLRTTELLDKLGSDQVLVKWLAATINPADINQIEGVYPTRPKLPATPGIEGVGRIEKAGSTVSTFKVGDHVIPYNSILGVYRELSVVSHEELFPVDKTLPIESSAFLMANPPSAYMMLKDFLQLKKGDTVIQNSANSAVGKQVIQMARIMGLKTLNIVRKRENLQQLIEELKGYGADEVITEEQFYTEKRKTKGIKLALNGVGGRSSQFLASHLDAGGCMVTYGGMRKQAVQCPTAPLIFKDISLRGYWVGRMYADRSPAAYQRRLDIYKVLSDWIKSGELLIPAAKKRSFEEYKDAFIEAQTKFDKKQLFWMN